MQIKLDIKEDEDTMIVCPYCSFPNKEGNKVCSMCERDVEARPICYDKK